MNPVNENRNNLQAQEMQNIEEDEGYEEPSSSSDVVVIPFQEDMRINEAMPKCIPSDVAPIRPSVIMPPPSILPDSTTSPPSSRNMERRRIRFNDSRRSSELARINIISQYLRELLAPGNAELREEHLIHSAAREGRTEVVEALVELGVDPNTLSDSGATALHEAARAGKHHTIQFLVSRGADLDRPADGGNTALHLAAEGGHYIAAWTLLESGALTEVRTATGITAMDYARDNGHLHIVELLQDYV